MSLSVVPNAFVHSKRLTCVLLTAILALGTACAKGDNKPALRDSALDRDLTLAASAVPPAPVAMTPLGDTARSNPEFTSPAENSTNRARPNNPPERVPTPAKVPAQPSTQPDPAP